MFDKPPLLVIVGPTAVGKTKHAIEVAKMLDSEIISADSMQIYKYMDIGTAKPTPEERQRIPHHMIDIVEPDEEFSVADYKELAEEKIKSIFEKGKIPLLVGGTGLYVKAVIDNYFFSDASIDKEYRETLKQIALEKGGDYLHDILNKKDPAAASRIHPNDIKRIIRALEVYYQTGKPISYFEKETQKGSTPYNLSYFGLTMSRERLYNLINQRVDDMIAKGLVDEVKGLLERGYNKELNALKGLGYKQIIGYLEGGYNLEKAIEILKRDTRRFAKRQFTWFKRDKRIKWINVEEISLKDCLLKNFNSILQENQKFPRISIEI
ncbi:MAG: tRNA dimethylallyltransferase [Thermosediminibacterales bacterium]|nr:tRNA dimethylallyltransferase [Thermosediminibacterales bacterium]